MTSRAVAGELAAAVDVPDRILALSGHAPLHLVPARGFFRLNRRPAGGELAGGDQAAMELKQRAPSPRRRGSIRTGCQPTARVVPPFVAIVVGVAFSRRRGRSRRSWLPPPSAPGWCQSKCRWRRSYKSPLLLTFQTTYSFWPGTLQATSYPSPFAPRRPACQRAELAGHDQAAVVLKERSRLSAGGVQLELIPQPAAKVVAPLVAIVIGEASSSTPR